MMIDSFVPRQSCSLLTGVTVGHSGPRDQQRDPQLCNGIVTQKKNNNDNNEYNTLYNRQERTNRTMDKTPMNPEHDIVDPSVLDRARSTAYRTRRNHGDPLLDAAQTHDVHVMIEEAIEQEDGEEKEEITIEEAVRLHLRVGERYPCHTVIHTDDVHRDIGPPKA